MTEHNHPLVAMSDGGGVELDAYMCAAIRSLAKCGWTIDEIAFALEVSDTAVQKHRIGKCSHEPMIVTPMDKHTNAQTVRKKRAMERLKARIGRNNPDRP